ncbi:Cytochrome P450 monooxygenase 98 [Psilocybe cubensis]|uniref:Cytochrome P450 monooxygenase 98 n=1 Tax=Psilocybe cubensis TaxID=181762 RepID=A0ACB8GNA0_PSICU|nr:Cytochrome P450 monooxygenase 98 [Psilocybe cubensis]KAH9476887.1 Cytochrome P450 monooxygenase 98 [Psilocybe cubensis]
MVIKSKESSSASPSLNMIQTVIVALALLAGLWFIRNKRAPSTPYSHLPLPPGPKRLPVIGNLLNMPAAAHDYHEWSKQYKSDIIYLDVPGSKMVVLDTYDAAFELLERRSAKYSSRARLTMVNELMGWDFALGFMEYGKAWRDRRRLMHNSFHPEAAKQFRPQLLKETRKMLERFLDTPNGDVMGNIRHMTRNIILQITYGLEVQPEGDPFIEVAERAIEGSLVASIPGNFLVNSFPFLKHVPDWFPGASFHKKAREWKGYGLKMIESPFSATKRNMAAGESPQCFVSTNLEKMETHDAAHERDIKLTAGSMYSGAQTLSAIGSCILGFLQKPEVLKKAQAEVDKMVKPGHLPDFEDIDSLPYITAITMEVLRWRVVGPIGVPHLLTEEDEYKGYRIPAGTTVIANQWAMLHDESVYPNPSDFNPDRFMLDGKVNPAVRDPSHACWGFGRRICPGRYMAFSSVWIAIASLVAVFDISNAVDDEGNVIEPTHEYTPNLIRVPVPYKCSITPRSPQSDRLIRASVHEELANA